MVEAKSRFCDQKKPEANENAEYHRPHKCLAVVAKMFTMSS